MGDRIFTKQPFYIQGTLSNKTFFVTGLLFVNNCFSALIFVNNVYNLIPAGRAKIKFRKPAQLAFTFQKKFILCFVYTISILLWTTPSPFYLNSISGKTVHFTHPYRV